MTSSVGPSIAEVAPDTYRINIPLPDALPGGFSFNQYLVVDEMPLLFHTGPKKLFPLISAQIGKVMPLDRLRYVAFSHFEADECGGLPQFLAAAPEARPVCSEVAAMVSVSDFVDVAPIGMRDGQELVLGRHRVVWQSAPHVPHGWECGFLFDATTRVLFSGDLFTQPGLGEQPVVDGDILSPSEAFRRQMDYYAHAPDTGKVIGKLADLDPAYLACMHGSAWRGNGRALLRDLGGALTA